MDNQENNLSFLDVELLLNEVGAENPNLANLIRKIIYDSPTKKMNTHAREVISKIINNQKNNDKKCQHNGCNSKSINSHVISKNKLDNFLGNKINDKIIIDVLDLDLKENPYKYNFKQKSTKFSCSFFGYCRDHDRDLFNELDNAGILYNNKLLNYQYLRMLYENIRNLESELKVFENIFNELKSLNNQSPNDISTDFINTREDKLKNTKNRLERSKEIYQKIWQGLVTGVFYITSKKYRLKKSGIIFSHFFDLTKGDDKEPYTFFILKEEYKKTSYIYFGTLCNENSIEIFESLDLHKFEGKQFLTELMLDSKDKLIFSTEFKKQINEKELSIFLKNQDLFPNEPIEIFLIQEILFNSEKKLYFYT